MEKLSIIQLNFLYLYRYCESIRFDVSIYEDIDIEDVSHEDINSILKFMLFNKGISNNLNELTYSEKISRYVKLSDTEVVATLGVANASKVTAIRDFSNKIDKISQLYEDRYFIGLLDDILNAMSYTEDAISSIEHAREFNAEPEDNSDILDLLL